MYNFNKVILNGRLCQDIQIVTTKENKQYAKFCLAVDRCMRGDEIIVDYVDCVAFDHEARFLNKYFTPGDGVILEGQLQTSTWKGEDGKSHKSVAVVAKDLAFAQGTIRRSVTEPVAEPAPEPAKAKKSSKK